jgi:hypothetical protein
VPVFKDTYFDHLLKWADLFQPVLQLCHHNSSNQIVQNRVRFSRALLMKKIIFDKNIKYLFTVAILKQNTSVLA